MAVQTVEVPLAAPFEVKTDPVKQVFWDAADLIERDGWIQYQAGDAGIGYCFMGAIWFAAANRFPKDPRYGHAVLDKAQHVAEESVCGGAVWNDTEGRTKEEVLSKLRELADAS